MSRTQHNDAGRLWAVPLLLVAAPILYAAGAMTAPADLRDLYELDALVQKYAVIAEHESAYRWANAVVAIAGVLGAVGTYRLTRAWNANGSAVRVAAIGLGLAAGAWVVLALLRITLVADRANDVAAGREVDEHSVADAALRGDGPFLVASLVAGAALVVLAVAWWRAGSIGRVTAALVLLGGVTTALLVRSDPLAVVFVPPFPFLLGFLPIGIVSLHRAFGSRRARPGVAVPS